MGDWTKRTAYSGGLTRKEEVTASESAVVRIPDGKTLVTVTAIPGEYGSALVEFSTSSEAEVIAETATWQNWPGGAVSAIKTDRVLGPITALRLSATTADAVFELVV